MDHDISSFSAQFKALVGEVTTDSLVGNPSWQDYLDRGVRLSQTVSDFDPAALDQTNNIAELEASAVDLWNFSVTLKTKGLGCQISNAKLRYIAFWLLEFCGQKSVNDTKLRRLVMTQTLQRWQTEYCIRLKRLQKQLIDRKLTVGEDIGLLRSIDKQKLELEQDHFTLLCYQAESCVGAGRPDEAIEHMMMAKELIPIFPKQAGFLSMLCYNSGVTLFQSKLYSQSIICLRESYELGKGTSAIGPKNQARTLRLLANVYLDYNAEENLQNAINAVSLANTEHCHPAGVFLKLKLLILQKAADPAVKRAIEELLQVSELTVDLGLHALRLIHDHQRMELLMWLIEELLKKFEHCPDLGKLLVTNLDVLLDAGMMKEAKELVEFCVTAHHTGRPLDIPIKSRFHNLFWEQAAAAYEKEQYDEALDWYNFSLSLYNQSDTGDVTLAKLHRNRANCYLQLQLLEKASDAIGKAVQFDPSSPHAHFLMFRLTLIENNSERACEALKKLCELPTVDEAGNEGDADTATSLVALAAQFALEADKLEAACVALQHLADTGTDTKQVLRALRCLIRLKLTAAEKEADDRNVAQEIAGHIKIGYTTLVKLQETESSEAVKAEADWLMKIAWNLALECEDWPEQMKDLYTVCLQLLCLSVEDDRNLSRQLTCLLMCSAACLQVARSSVEIEHRESLLRECLEHLASCRQLSEKVQQHAIGVTEARSKEMDVLLLLYEFEARVQLKDPAVEGVLEKALVMSGSDPKIFETMAALATEGHCQNKSVAVRALKVAIRKHLQTPTPEVIKCSKLYHSLIQLCLSGGSNQSLGSKDEAWNYYNEILDVLDNVGKNQYPEMEIVWLMTKAWNCGINFYSGSRYKEAEKWCGLSMRMLKYLDTFKNNYQDHMSGVYGDILAKVETSAGAGRGEADL